jgi:hypothetical protein
LAAQNAEDDIGTRIGNKRLAGQSIIATQELLSVRRWRKRVGAPPDLDNAFVALAGPATRCRDPDRQGIGEIVERLVFLRVKPLGIEINRTQISKTSSGGSTGNIIW